MLTFFRRIRKGLLGDGATSKYLVYAIGEIALVVIGILIALQINNWNTAKFKQIQIKEYSISLIKDLQADMSDIEVIMNQAREIQNRIDSLAKYVNRHSFEDITNLNVLCLTWSTLYRPFNWNRGTIDELKSSGNLINIKNDSISNAITAYDAFTHHLDEDFIGDNAYSDKATEIISIFVNSNYPNIKELTKVLRLHHIKLGGYDFFQSEAYKIAQEYKLDFIEKDEKSLNIAVNSLITLEKHLGVRTNIEFPRLILDAERIIEMLKAEYHLCDEL